VCSLAAYKAGNISADGYDLTAHTSSGSKGVINHHLDRLHQSLEREQRDTQNIASGNKLGLKRKQTH
jgi:hypothetical protein